jgi:hypothetical protein
MGYEDNMAYFTRKWTSDIFVVFKFTRKWTSDIFVVFKLSPGQHGILHKEMDK